MRDVIYNKREKERHRGKTIANTVQSIQNNDAYLTYYQTIDIGSKYTNKIHTCVSVAERHGLNGREEEGQRAKR